MENESVVDAMSSEISEAVMDTLEEAMSIEETEPNRHERITAAIDAQNTQNALNEYKQKTGKRFRMTKEQKQRGLSREEAFEEFLDKLDEELNS